jgi:hypothetical protein
MKTKSSIVGAAIAAALTLGVAGVAYAYADPPTIDSGARITSSWPLFSSPH